MNAPVEVSSIERGMMEIIKRGKSARPEIVLECVAKLLLRDDGGKQTAGQSQFDALSLLNAWEMVQND